MTKTNAAKVDGVFRTRSLGIAASGESPSPSPSRLSLSSFLSISTLSICVDSLYSSSTESRHWEWDSESISLSDVIQNWAKIDDECCFNQKTKQLEHTIKWVLAHDHSSFHCNCIITIWIQLVSFSVLFSYPCSHQMLYLPSQMSHIMFYLLNPHSHKMLYHVGAPRHHCYGLMVHN